MFHFEKLDPQQKRIIVLIDTNESVFQQTNDITKNFQTPNTSSVRKISENLQNLEDHSGHNNPGRIVYFLSDDVHSLIHNLKNSKSKKFTKVKIINDH